MKESIKKTLAGVLLLSALAVGAGAVPEAVDDMEAIVSETNAAQLMTDITGTCGIEGDNLIWSLNIETCVLTISGSGEMVNYSSDSLAEWSTSFPDLVKNVVVESGVTSISNFAFAGCESLTNISLPDSLTKIGNYAFYYCKSLESIDIPDNVTSVGYSSFYRCTNLTSVTIGNSVTSIGKETFYLCSNLSNLTIGNSITYIADSAFERCSSLTTVTIPGSVTYLGNSAFIGCQNLKEVFFSVGLTYIGPSAFASCSNLTNVTIPDSVTSIGDKAFDSCYNLKNVKISDSVTSIGTGAFHDCHSLEAITVDEDNAYYSSDKRGALFNKDKTNLIQYPVGNTASSYTIPNSVIYIEEDAFYSCNNLTTINIPNSVTSIGKTAFWNCNNLTNINIQNNVTTIGYMAFGYCGNLASVTIPDSVIDIDDYAFNSCESLKTITVLSKNVTFGSSVFNSCENLTIYGYTGSTAETYAKANGIPFINSLTSITIYLPALSSSNNTIYSEINGIQTKIDGNVYEVEIGEENLFIEFVEKTDAGEVVKSVYYFVDMTAKTATKLDMDCFMTSYNSKEIRVKNPMGLRFKAQIQKAPKVEEDAFVIDEYGFIIATEESLGDDVLTLDFAKIAKGVAYNKADNINVVFDSTNDEFDIFAGVLKNIPVKNYKTDLICKTYTKISVGDEQFVVYGEEVKGNLYDTARLYPDDEDAKCIVDEYDKYEEYIKNIEINGDSLFD